MSGVVELLRLLTAEGFSQEEALAMARSSISAQKKLCVDGEMEQARKRYARGCKPWLDEPMHDRYGSL